MATEFQVDLLQLPPDALFASLDWLSADPDFLLDEIGREGAWDTASLGAVLRMPSDNNNNLDAFAAAYFWGRAGFELWATRGF
ncbi:hypothetical protein LY78DRAFT_656148 [Colletotrichum sublineola]|nr:hypothetical protein LY78DRAFT_656148 [Colletotrichum sublineola]